jgi:hypothetical protein
MKLCLRVGLGVSALSTIALVAALVVPAATASASVSTVPKGVWNYIWKPGTPLPRIAAGYELEAWPVYALGEALPDKTPMVPIASTASTGKVKLTASAATIRSVTSNGTVNLISVPQGCPAPATTNLGKRATIVGAAYSTTYATQMIFTYTRSQNSSLEVGISDNPTSGFTFDGDVSKSRSSSASEGFGTQYHINRLHYETDFRYGRDHYVCATRKGFSSFYVDSAYEWAGGVIYGRAGAAPKASHGNCVPQPKGSKFTLNATTAFQFSAGFSVPGFNGSAQTGYDTETSIEFKFPYASAYLCGLSDVPGGSDPRILFAQAKG